MNTQILLKKEIIGKYKEFIPVRHFNTLQSMTKTEAIKKVDEYLDSKTLFLLMTGTVGTGKTVSGYYAGLKKIEKGIVNSYLPEIAIENPPFFKIVKASNLIDIIINDKNEFQKIKDSYFLIIDELGTESHINKNYWDSQLDLLIDYRYEKMLQTMIISNLTLEKIKERYPARMIDRLKGETMFCNIVSDSMRGRSI